MPNLKKLLVLLLAVALLLTFVACGAKNPHPYQEDDDNNPSSEPESTTDIAAKICGQVVSSVIMNYYFTDYTKTLYSQWESQYGEYVGTFVGLMGLDVDVPLTEQTWDQETGQTWADYFLIEVLAKAKSDYALYARATAEGYTLSAEEQTSLSNTTTMVELYSKLYGYQNTNEYLEGMYGKGSTLDSYAEYSKITTIAKSYYLHYEASLTYDAAALRAYEATNPDYYASFDTRSLGNVRHLLVAFDGGTVDDATGMTIYSPEEKDAAKFRANQLLYAWENGEATEASFIALVNQHTDDLSSKETGGLYEDIHPQSLYVENFLNWSIDPNRQVGDVGIVESVYGYHIMYYSSHDELTYRDYMIREDLRAKDVADWYNAILSAVTASIENTKHLNTGIIFSEFAQPITNGSIIIQKSN